MGRESRGGVGAGGEGHSGESSPGPRPGDLAPSPGSTGCHRRNELNNRKKSSAVRES